MASSPVLEAARGRHPASTKRIQSGEPSVHPSSPSYTHHSLLALPLRPRQPPRHGPPICHLQSGISHRQRRLTLRPCPSSPISTALAASVLPIAPPSPLPLCFPFSPPFRPSSPAPVWLLANMCVAENSVDLYTSTCPMCKFFRNNARCDLLLYSFRRLLAHSSV